MWWQRYKDSWDFAVARVRKWVSPQASVLVSGIGLCYFLAFLSLIPQLPGLIGETGLLPVEALKAAYDYHYGAAAFWEMKSLAWWVSSGTGLQILAVVGLIASVGVVLFRSTVALFLAWLIYGSLFVAGQAFLSFQWDSLLLEAGIAGICLAYVLPKSPKKQLSATSPDADMFVSQADRSLWPAVLLIRLLAAKVMISAGLAKWLSGDIWWREGTALSVHFETQPLPTVLGWFCHQLPFSVLMLGIAWMWVAEIVAPILAFVPGRIRFYSALCMILFQVMIFLTGNYGFFNVLMVVLLLSFWVPSTEKMRIPTHVGWRGWLLKHAFPLVLIITLGLGFGNRFVFQSPHLGQLEAMLASWRIQFQYGLFAVMTYPRWEIVLAVSEDKQQWTPISFYYKPDSRNQLPWVAPHMPRLDWMMWFAALHPAPLQLPWLQQLAEGIRKRDPAVLSLLPPLPAGDFQYIQIERREYRFSDPEERQRKGVFWVEVTPVF